MLSIWSWGASHRANDPPLTFQNYLAPCSIINEYEAVALEKYSWIL